MQVSTLPQLRFPEFTGEYKSSKVANVLTRIVNPVSLENSINYTEIGVRSWGKGIFHKKKTTKEQIGNKRVFWLEADLFIVNIVFAWEQAVAKTTEKEIGKIASHRFPMFRPNPELADLDYLVWLFLTNKGKHLLEMASPGGAGRNKTLGQKEFERLQLHLPSICEQRKVSQAINLVDTKIKLLKEKHKMLTKYKKGVMQRLFEQKIRFKDDDGNYFPDWQECTLLDIATPIKRKATETVENVMTISAGKGFMSQKERFSQVIAGTSLNKYTHLKQGEFSYNRGNSKSYTYGCIYKLDKEDALVPYVYRSFSLDRGNADFFSQLFQFKYLDRQLRRIISSSARMDGLLNISEKDFYQVRVPFPHDDEQKKIAEFLDALDKKLDSINQQIELTQAFKKGLLQQMFV